MARLLVHYMVRLRGLCASFSMHFILSVNCTIRDRSYLATTSLSLKMSSIDNKDIINQIFCLHRQVWILTSVTTQPISDYINNSHRCRQVQTVPNSEHSPNELKLQTVNLNKIYWPLDSFYPLVLNGSIMRYCCSRISVINALQIDNVDFFALLSKEAGICQYQSA